MSNEMPPTKQGEPISKERAEFLLQWISDKAHGGFGPLPAEIEFLLRHYLACLDLPMSIPYGNTQHVKALVQNRLSRDDIVERP